jgi:hypothetical protein
MAVAPHYEAESGVADATPLSVCVHSRRRAN